MLYRLSQRKSDTEQGSSSSRLNSNTCSSPLSLVMSDSSQGINELHEVHDWRWSMKFETYMYFQLLLFQLQLHNPCKHWLIANWQWRVYQWHIGECQTNSVIVQIKFDTNIMWSRRSMILLHSSLHIQSSPCTRVNMYVMHCFRLNFYIWYPVACFNWLRMHRMALSTATSAQE